MSVNEYTATTGAKLSAGSLRLTSYQNLKMIYLLLVLIRCKS